MPSVKIDTSKIKHYHHRSITDLNNMITNYGLIAEKVPKDKDSYFNYYIQPVGYEPFNIFYFRTVPYILGGMLLKKGNSFHSSYCQVSMRVPFPKKARQDFKKCFPEVFFTADSKEALFLSDISLDIKGLIISHPKTFNDKFTSRVAKKLYKKVIKRMNYYKNLSLKKVDNSK